MKQPKKKYSFTTKGISGDIAGDFAKKTGEMVKNLPQFNYRGTDAFKESLSKGPNAVAEVSFTKGEDKKYPYLSSRYTIGGDRTNPMKTTGGADDRSQTYTGRGVNGIGSNSNARTISEDNLNREVSRAKQSITGNRTYLSEQEKAAKASSSIGENLQASMSSGDEKGFSKAVYKAQDDTRESKAQLLKRPPGKDRKGNYIENDASYQNAKMIDAFNTARQDAVGAQDFADFSRGLKGRIKTLKADLSNGFKTTFDERSGS